MEEIILEYLNGLKMQSYVFLIREMQKEISQSWTRRHRQKRRKQCDTD